MIWRLEDFPILDLGTGARIFLVWVSIRPAAGLIPFALLHFARVAFMHTSPVRGRPPM